MSRRTGVWAGIRRTARRINVAGVARVVLVSGAAVGLVYVATNRPVSVDLVTATGEQQAPLVGTSLATRVAQTCPGPELTGRAVHDDVGGHRVGTGVGEDEPFLAARAARNGSSLSLIHI